MIRLMLDCRCYGDAIFLIPSATIFLYADINSRRSHISCVMAGVLPGRHFAILMSFGGPVAEAVAPRLIHGSRHATRQYELYFISHIEPHLFRRRAFSCYSDIAARWQY